MSDREVLPAVSVVDPTGARLSLTLGPGGHVALFARALHAPQAAEMTRRSGSPGLVEVCTAGRGADGRALPRRRADAEHFPRCGDVAALQHVAGRARDQGVEAWCAVLARTDRVLGGGAVKGGAVLWADVDTLGAIWRVRALAARVPLRLVVESAGAVDPAEARVHLYVAVSRWLEPDELEHANSASRSSSAATASATAAG